MSPAAGCAVGGDGIAASGEPLRESLDAEDVSNPVLAAPVRVVQVEVRRGRRTAGSDHDSFLPPLEQGVHLRDVGRECIVDLRADEAVGRDVIQPAE